VFEAKEMIWLKLDQLLDLGVSICWFNVDIQANLAADGVQGTKRWGTTTFGFDNYKEIEWQKSLFTDVHI